MPRIYFRIGANLTLLYLVQIPGPIPRTQKTLTYVINLRQRVEPHGLTPVAPSTHFVGRNPPTRRPKPMDGVPKRILLRQGYGEYPPRNHPRVYIRGFLQRRVKDHKQQHFGFREFPKAEML